MAEFSLLSGLDKLGLAEEISVDLKSPVPINCHLKGEKSQGGISGIGTNS